jgi:asparagine synthetase B (glutamine-hydrolysing)
MLDVLIVGGGNAALCAALMAREAGASVGLLEASPRAWRGGNSQHTRNLRCMHDAPTRRLLDCLDALAEAARRPLDIVEDFFYRVHLPGLLRRMDFASMAASKEARVPFADRRLVELCYRTPVESRLDAQASKKPLRALLARLGLHGPLARPKIGFAARADAQASRDQEYRAFQAHNLEALGWS